MALIGKMHKYLGTLAGAISIGLILLLLGGDIVQLRTALAGRGEVLVGRVAHQKIYHSVYQERLERLRNVLPDTDLSLREKVWQQLLEEVLYAKECNALDITVGSDELVDMVQGEHIHPALHVLFRQPKTGKFDIQDLITYLSNLSRVDTAQRAQWHHIERMLVDSRKQEKINHLMGRSLFTTTLAHQHLTEAKLHVRYVYVPYHTYPDSKIVCTERMLKDYLKKNKHLYQVKESRKVQYVNFNLQPTEEDYQDFQKVLCRLKADFAQVSDSLLFARQHTDGAPEAIHLKLTSKELSHALAQQIDNLEVGAVIGPVQEDEGVYRLYKLITDRTQAQPWYEVVTIEKRFTASDRTHDQLFKQADHWASHVNNTAQFISHAQQSALQVYSAEVGKYDEQVGDLPQARALVRWLYNDACTGQVSPVLELDGKYVVAVMTHQYTEGLAALEQVRDHLELKVRNACKAREIIARLVPLAGMPLAEQAAQYGEAASVLEAKSLSFGDDALPNVGLSRKAIGAAFGLAPGAQTIIADEYGVFVVEVVSQEDQQAIQEFSACIRSHALVPIAYSDEQHNHVLKALEQLTVIQDQRYRFY